MKARFARLSDGVPKGQFTKEMKDFVDALSNFSKPSDVPAEFIESCKTVQEENVEDEAGKWISWAKASEEEGGDDILMEMARSGAITMRLNTKLAPDTAIPYPRNQQVAYISETWSKRRKTTRTITSHEKPTIDKDTFDAQYAQAGQRILQRTPILPQPQQAGTPTPPKDESEEKPAENIKDGKKKDRPARDKTTVSALRKSHNAMDREMRNVNATIVDSAVCKMTQNSEVETKLAAWLVKAKTLDDALTKQEQQYIQGRDYTDGQIKEAVDNIKACNDWLSKGKQYHQSLTNLLNLGRMDAIEDN